MVIVSFDVLAAMTSVKASFAVAPAVSATCIEKLNVLAADGVPASVPLEPFNEMPAGRTPWMTVQLYGGLPPDALSVWEYALPTVP